MGRVVRVEIELNKLGSGI